MGGAGVLVIGALIVGALTGSEKTSDAALRATPSPVSTPFTQADAPAGSYNPAGGVNKGLSSAKAVPGAATAGRSSTSTPPPAVFAAGVSVVDTTPTLAGPFGLDVSSFEPDPTAVVTASPNPCLQSWASKTLPSLGGKSFVKELTVCGHRVAAIAGGYATSPRDLLLHAFANEKYKALGSLLSSSNGLSFASVASSDGKAVLVVAGPSF